MPPRSSAPRCERQRQRLRDHPRGGADASQTDPRGQAAATRAHAPFPVAARDRRHHDPARTRDRTWRARIVAAIHMDMVGGGPATKAVFRVTRSPASLPTFVNDVAETVADFVNEQTLAYASGAAATYPLIAAGGGKEALARLHRRVHSRQRSRRADGRRRSGSRRSISMTGLIATFTPTATCRPTSIRRNCKRAGFIGAGTGWYLANFAAADTDQLLGVLDRKRLVRTARMLGRSDTLRSDEAAVLRRFHWAYEREVVESVGRFARADSGTAQCRCATDRRNCRTSTAMAAWRRIPGMRTGLYAQ